MADGGDEVARGAGDAAAALEAEGHVGQAVAGDALGVGPADALADGLEVDGVLLGAVGDADAAAEVDEVEPDAEPVVELGGEVEEEDGGVDEVLRVELVAGDHGVQAEALDALGLEHGVGLEELVAGQAVLRLLGLADDGVAALEGAGVVAQADALGQAGDALEEGDVGDVVEVDVGAQGLGLHELLGGGVVGGEHDGVAGQADALGEEQLGQRGAVGR